MMPKVGRFLALTVLSSGMACSNPPPVPGPWGGSTSSTSGGPTNGIPLEQLCQRVADGYLNIIAASMVVDYQRRGGLECPQGSFTEQDILDLYRLYYEPYLEGACSDGEAADPYSSYYALFGRGMVKAIADGEARGRVIYDGEMAGQCDRLGEQQALAAGGRAAWMSTWWNLDGGVVDAALPRECREFLRGLQGEGEPCVTNVECEQGAQGATCVGPLGPGCEGRCRANATEGQPCEGGTEPACVPGLECVHDGDSSQPGTCRGPVGANEPCRSDGGTTRRCEDGLTCMSSGRCQERLGEGTGCASNEECRSGLTCRGTPPRCLGPAGEGESCEGASCEVCLSCWRPPGSDGGATCMTPVAEGQPCTNAPCAYPSQCFQGACVRALAEGELCQDDVVASQLVSNCRLGLVCASEPKTCRRPGAAGEPCRSLPGPTASQGTCRAGFVCGRSSPAATAGTCLAPAKAGEPCGNRHDVHSACWFDYSVYFTGNYSGFLTCSANGDGGTGVCYPYYGGAEGEPCSYSCSPGLYCSRGDGGSLGQCRPGAAVGQACDTTGYVCQEGVCEFSFEDGGYRYRCVPPRALGETCTSSGQCGADAYCQLPDGGGEGTCTPRHAEGQACTRYDQCVSGMACQDGVCIASTCATQNSLSSCANVDLLAPYLFWGILIGGGANRWKRRRKG
ncbi:MAG: dickkopf-related protein [Myxococcota bacterium]